MSMHSAYEDRKQSDQTFKYTAAQCQTTLQNEHIQDWKQSDQIFKYTAA
jgi:hypothetical protein